MAKRCRSCCSSCVVTVTVRGCPGIGGSPVEGAAVEIRQFGVLMGSGTSNSSGQVIFTVPRASISSITSSKSRFNNGGPTGVTTTGATAVVSVNMSAATGYVCQPSASCTTAPLRCADPIASTLTLTLSSGTKTLTSSGGQWTLTETRSGAKFIYSTVGCNLSYNYCVLGNAGDPTCTNPASFSGPTTFTFGGVTCPPLGFLISGSLTSPYDSGPWSITE